MCVCTLCIFLSNKHSPNFGTHTVNLLFYLLCWKESWEKVERIALKRMNGWSTWNKRMQNMGAKLQITMCEFNLIMSSFPVSLPQRSQRQATFTFMQRWTHCTSWWGRISPNQIKISFLTTVGFNLKSPFPMGADEWIEKIILGSLKYCYWLCPYEMPPAAVKYPHTSFLNQTHVLRPFYVLYNASFTCHMDCLT